MLQQNIIPTFDLYKTLDNHLGFEFSNLEESYNAYDASLPHRHNYYEILLFKASGGTHEIDFNIYPIRKNSLHFISPEQVHLLRRENHVTGYVLSFTPEFCLREAAGPSFIDGFSFFNNPYAYPIVLLNEIGQRINLFDIISKIQSEYLSSHNDRAEALFAWLSILLVTARRIHSAQSASDGDHGEARTKLTHQFKKLADKNFRQTKSVAEYARLLNISAGHLNDTVHKDTGKTAGDIIHDRIILEAKRLLYHSPKSVKEIAWELGYEDPSYFARFFKMHAHISPELFRAQIREKYH